VFPSEREGLPVNLMESLAMGVPVITVDSRGCRDVVRDGETGVVLSDRSRDALSREMLRFQRDKEELKRLSANARAGRKRYDRKKFIESQLAIFERLTGKTA
ncbi:MAG: glycosyltransferase, partial [Cryomorphaceae bacterium]